MVIKNFFNLVAMYIIHFEQLKIYFYPYTQCLQD